MKNITLKQRLHYHFDNLMSKGPVALIGWLFLLSVALITIVSLFVMITGIDPDKRGFLDLAWFSLMRTLDAGTMGGDNGNWLFLIAMLIVTMGGIFVVSTLIGVLTTGLESQLERLRKGRSFVAEEGHTLVLGWSDHIFTILQQLIVANSDKPDSCIVILAPKDKVEMEDELRDRLAKTGRTRIVCRTGSPLDLNDLKIVNPQSARVIVVLPSEGEDPDAQVIKTLLALTHDRKNRTHPQHMVSVIENPQNLQVARIAGHDQVELLLTGELIARIAAQTCRQPGLSAVYSELLDFEGDETYFHSEPQLVGKSFSEALLAYESACILGLQRADGSVQLNPPMQTVIGEGDKLILIAADDSLIRFSGVTNPPVDTSAICLEPFPPTPPEHTLLLGWNRFAPILLHELDNYVAPGSSVTVVADTLSDADGHQPVAIKEPPALSTGETVPTNGNGAVPYRHLHTAFMQGDTTDRRTLDSLDIQTYDHMIVLSYADTLDAQQADARTLVTLLHLRDIGNKGGYPFSIVSEMVDSRNRDLAEVTQADDFIVSDKLISLLLAQIAEHKERARVFDDLFDPEGAEVYLKPATGYVQPNKPVTFYTVVEAARRRGEVAIGYRLHADAHNAQNAYGIKLNPNKSTAVTLTPNDRVIVLSES